MSQDVGRRNAAMVAEGGPAQRLKLIAQSDANQAVPLMALRVTVPTAGLNLKITDLDGNECTLNYPTAGVFWEPVGAARVWDTGSDDTLIVHGVPQT